MNDDAERWIQTDVFSPFCLEKKIRALHTPSQRPYTRARMMFENGQIMTSGNTVIRASIPGLKMNFGAGLGAVVFPASMTDAAIVSLHRELGVAVCLEILARTCSLPDASSNFDADELQLLEHLDGTAHASNWTAWDARRAEKEEIRGIDRWSLVVAPKQPTV